MNNEESRTRPLTPDRPVVPVSATPMLRVPVVLGLPRAITLLMGFPKRTNLARSHCFRIVSVTTIFTSPPFLMVNAPDRCASANRQQVTSGTGRLTADLGGGLMTVRGRCVRPICNSATGNRHSRRRCGCHRRRAAGEAERPQPSGAGLSGKPRSRHAGDDIEARGNSGGRHRRELRGNRDGDAGRGRQCKLGPPTQLRNCASPSCDEGTAILAAINQTRWRVAYAG